MSQVLEIDPRAVALEMWGLKVECRRGCGYTETSKARSHGVDTVTPLREGERALDEPESKQPSTLWKPQREGRGRTQKESDGVSGTQPLETTEEGTR